MFTRIRESIRLRFILTFMGSLVLASLLTFPTILISESRRVMYSIERQLTTDADKIEILSTETPLPPQKIGRMAQSEAVEILVFTDAQMLDTLAGEPLALADGQRKLLAWGLQEGLPRLALRHGDNYYLLVPSVDNNQYENLKDVALRVLWACTLIGSFMMLVAMRTITDPVRRLNAATKRVAQGDFDVDLPEGARDELGQLTHNFNLMTQQLKQMETLRSDFISSISHEFKTPLASIQGFARLLQNKNLPAERMEEYTQVILEETTRLTTLSSNILRLNALENQSIPRKAMEFSLDEQIRRCVLVLASAWEPKQIEFDMNLDPVQYFGDQDLLQQVWQNLIGNAIKFSYQGGKITLGLTRTRSGIFITCQDYGAGISAADTQRIFEKFYQADRSRAREGNGLGLSIVQQILNLCGGSIRFESQPGKGSTFIVQLPHPQREALEPPAKRTGTGDERQTADEKRRKGDKEKGENSL